MNNILNSLLKQCSLIESRVSKLENELVKQFLKILVNANDTKCKKQACYDITNFIRFDFFNKELSDIISIAGELELPDKHIQGDFNKRFNVLITKLKGMIK